MKAFSLLLLLSLSFMISRAQQHTQTNVSDFIKEINDQRKLKDKEFANEKNSPIPEEEKKSFQGLMYFEPDPQFKVISRLEKYDNPFHFKMKTTTDRLPEYALYGNITFILKGQEYKLNVYQNIDLLKKPGYENYLFIPFNDLTNGKETYGGGRFMDAEVPDSDTLLIDFNKAYNPYCAYNHKYSCPIPPEENNLQIRLEAGEKKWHD